MTELYEFKTLLNDTAKELTQALSTVGQLRGWVVYLLEALEVETQNRVAYEEMLVDLVEDVQLRIDSGGWIYNYER
jgi:hypothetical protein